MVIFPGSDSDAKSFHALLKGSLIKSQALRNHPYLHVTTANTVREEILPGLHFSTQDSWKQCWEPRRKRGLAVSWLFCVLACWDWFWLHLTGLRHGSLFSASCVQTAIRKHWPRSSEEKATKEYTQKLSPPSPPRSTRQASRGLPAPEAAACTRESLPGSR